LAEDLHLARAVSEAALATNGVYSLGAGRYVEAATYGAGDKVTGVVVGPDEVRVHIVVRYPLPEPIPALAERIREKVRLRAGGRATTVVVEDLEVVQDENL
jgi:uncharacterized alkaline shock family protein YloU